MSSSNFRPIPKTLRDLLAKLDYIASVPTGFKLNVTRTRYCDTKNLFDWVNRKFFLKEDANDTILFTEDTIRETIEALNSYYKVDKELFDIVFEFLKKSRRGVIELSATYSDNTEAKTRLEVILKDIDMQVNKDLSK